MKIIVFAIFLLNVTLNYLFVEILSMCKFDCRVYLRQLKETQAGVCKAANPGAPFFFLALIGYTPINKLDCRY